MQRIIYFDIDDTLVRSFGAKRIPMPSVVESVRRLKLEGALLYMWSSGGSEYCRRTADELGASRLSFRSLRSMLTINPFKSGNYVATYIRRRQKMPDHLINRMACALRVSAAGYRTSCWGRLRPTLGAP
jgi:hypothetical protein